MNHKAKTGRKGEELAREYLLSNGYVVLEMNYRNKRNEIDIIARHDNILVFVEVKTRSYNSFGYPEEFVDDSKEDRIMEAAENYIYEVDWQKDIRFDVIAIQLSDNSHQITHFEDAFY